MKNNHISTFPFLSASNAEKPTYYSHHNKGFINYLFCRNWAVRNPSGTRLDSSSLVNKQVATVVASVTAVTSVTAVITETALTAVTVVTSVTSLTAVAVVTAVLCPSYQETRR